MDDVLKVFVLVVLNILSESFYCNSFSRSGKNPDHPENELQFFIAGSEKQKKKHRCDPASVLLHETRACGRSTGFK